MSEMLREFIYKNIGKRIQKIKHDQYIKEADTIYNSMCKRDNVAWDNNKANAFQHAYVSAKLTYEHDIDVAIFMGNFAEWSLWDSEQKNDINKDLYNNKTGATLADYGIKNNWTLTEIAELLFHKIESNSSDLIINAEEYGDREYINNLSYETLGSDTVLKGLNLGFEKLEMINLLAGISVPLALVIVQNY